MRCIALSVERGMLNREPFVKYSDLTKKKKKTPSSFQMIKESKTNVTALFFYHGVKNEIELWRKEAKSEEEKKKNLEKSKISIRKYAKVILLCKFFLRSKSSLEIRIVGDQETYNVEEVEKETFALIRLKGMMTNVTMTSTTMTTLTSTTTSAIMTTTTVMFSIIC